MKRTILYALTAFLLVSCSKEAQIKGYVDPALDWNGQTATLQIRENDSVWTKDTCEINQNSFLFGAKANTPYMTTIEIGEERFPICIEEGEIRINILSPNGQNNNIQIHCSGTQNNELLELYNTATNDFYNRYEALEKAGKEESEEAKVLEDTYIAQVYELIYNTAGTVFSKEIFMQTHYYFTTEQKLSYFRIMDDATMQIPKMKRVYEATQREADTAEGKPYIDFSGCTPAGDTLTLSDFVGKTDYVLIDFWASWCGPCRRAMPEVKEFYEAHKGEIEIIGVSLDQEYEAWTNAIKTMDLPWKHISDLQGWQAAPAKVYGVSAIPTTILINKEGIIVGRQKSLKEIEETYFFR